MNITYAESLMKVSHELNKDRPMGEASETAIKALDFVKWINGWLDWMEPIDAQIIKCNLEKRGLFIERK